MKNKIIIDISLLWLIFKFVKEGTDQYITLHAFFYKQHFYKQHQAEIGKKSSKS